MAKVIVTNLNLEEEVKIINQDLGRKNCRAFSNEGRES